MKNITALLTTLTLVLLPGCAVLEKNPTVTVATEQLVLPLLLDKLPADKRVEVRKYASGLAAAVRTLDPKNPPTALAFRDLIAKWLPTNDSTYQTLSLLVSTIYVNQVLPKISASGKLSSADIEVLATALDALAK